MFHRSWHSSVVLGEACALDVNTFLLLLLVYKTYLLLEWWLSACAKHKLEGTVTANFRRFKT